MNTLLRSNVTVSGRPGGQPIVFAHGFGCAADGRSDDDVCLLVFALAEG